MSGELSHVPEVFNMGGKDHEEDVKLGEGLELGTIHPAHSYDGKSQGLTEAKENSTTSMDGAEGVETMKQGHKADYEKARLAKEDSACEKSARAMWTRGGG